MVSPPKVLDIDISIYIEEVENSFVSPKNKEELSSMPLNSSHEPSVPLQSSHRPSVSLHSSCQPSAPLQSSIRAPSRNSEQITARPSITGVDFQAQEMSGVTNLE